MGFRANNTMHGGLREMRRQQHCRTCGLPTYTTAEPKSKIDLATGVNMPIGKDCECKSCNCLFCRQRRGWIND